MSRPNVDRVLARVEEELSGRKQNLVLGENTPSDTRDRVRRVDLRGLSADLRSMEAHKQEIGKVNPRSSGVHNKVIQLFKHLTRRTLSWYTRALQECFADTSRFASKQLNALQMLDSNIAILEQQVARNDKSKSDFISFRQDLERDVASFRQEVERKVQDFRQELEGTTKWLVSSKGVVDSMWERIEFMRREMLFEIKYSQPSMSPASQEQQVKVLVPEKVAAARTSGLRLNLGCGHIPIEGYLNVDQRELPNVDIVAAVDNLPFEGGSIREIFSAHLLEHFPQEELRRRLLPYWRFLLVPGGTFRAVVPDGKAMLEAVAEGSYSFEEFREVLFGAQDYAGDFHYNLFTPASLCRLLAEIGFEQIQVIDEGRRNGKCFECEVVAMKSK